jgi:hypothetical protein
MKPPHLPPVSDPPDGDAEAPPSEEELRAAESLRASLEPGHDRAHRHPDAELAEAVRSAARPSRLSADRHRRILDRSLADRPKSRVIYVVFGGVASLAAMAASIALVVRTTASSPSAAVAGAPVGAGAEAAPAMAISRSTAELFPEGIPVTGGTSDRIDRIAYARAQDLRENRFARWGVR